MPNIYDNIDKHLVDALRDAMTDATRLDVCVGYFNLRGWSSLATHVDKLDGTHPCRVLVGMNVQTPEDELREQLYREAFDGNSGRQLLDSKAFQKRRKEMAERFKAQLVLGTPNNFDEAALRRLAKQLRANKVKVKLFTRHPLHAKLYIVHQHYRLFPAIAYLGSSNLTLAGLSKQGELNVDVKEDDANQKLLAWFDERWGDDRAVDISEELADIIDESWAREEPVSPYHVYLKIAWHLSRDARQGIDDFKIPAPFDTQLYDFQARAVQIAARHLHRNGGVMIGDVVGLGKTMMACALAKIRNQLDQGVLILCPKNLESMWEWHRKHYDLAAEVIPTSMARKRLPNLKRYTVVIVDESHNLRNREGKTYEAIRDYIARNESDVILLSATPYNKAYTDLSAQLRLFVSPDADLRVTPKKAIEAEGGVAEFSRKYPNISIRRLAAFEKSPHPDDWLDLMRNYLVRRTRSFIKKHHAHEDERGRKFLMKENGERAYFPDRVPRNVVFETVVDGMPTPYARLVSDDVVNRIDSLRLPRYGLSTYLSPEAERIANAAEKKTIADLSTAGVRLMGFTRTNLFKRLESSGDAFLLSLKRHAIRNLVFLHALEHRLDLPIGATNAHDIRTDDIHGDEDPDAPESDAIDIEAEVNGTETTPDAAPDSTAVNREQYRAIAEETYERFAGKERKRFAWVRPTLFTPDLADALRHDTDRILEILELAGRWNPASDRKLVQLRELLTHQHPAEKVLIFTQYADTAEYLRDQLAGTVPGRVESVTGRAGDPMAIARRFSPRSNDVKGVVADEIRVLITTDVLSEGQNLQDAHIVVNYDLPWAIIRLIQRVGRVDRIGQQAETITCYSFLPHDGVEEIIRLRERVRQRLTENAEVVGADERFFEDDGTEGNSRIIDLYSGNPAALEEDDDPRDVDIASQALQIWQDATEANPALRKAVETLPPMIYAAKPLGCTEPATPGALAYLQMGDESDTLVRVDSAGELITQSPLEILEAAACEPDTPARYRTDGFHRLVTDATRVAWKQIESTGSALGSARSVRRRLYDRLKAYQEDISGNVLAPDDHRRLVPQIVTAILRRPVLETVTPQLNRELRSGISSKDLADLCINLYAEERLVGEEIDASNQQPTIICSLELQSDQ